jgi:hypothetical protein
MRKNPEQGKMRHLPEDDVRTLATCRPVESGVNGGGTVKVLSDDDSSLTTYQYRNV